ncbi:hypothetical protein GCM10010339_45070 [Streptomyces alanosinicus]|uniref:Uncharacterized protein n=1 Tax=Streptomyces alanosinicus TaxID=68171 RepID=A0A918YJB2_9ACTN|nr:hypothetical protein GCM10010339_45070 [Streptomyces alanosinicus]
MARAARTLRVGFMATAADERTQLITADFSPSTTGTPAPAAPVSDDLPADTPGRPPARMPASRRAFSARIPIRRGGFFHARGRAPALAGPS